MLVSYSVSRFQNGTGHCVQREISTSLNETSIERPGSRSET